MKDEKISIYRILPIVGIILTAIVSILRNMREIWKNPEDGQKRSSAGRKKSSGVSRSIGHLRSGSRMDHGSENEIKPFSAAMR